MRKDHNEAVLDQLAEVGFLAYLTLALLVQRCLWVDKLNFNFYNFNFRMKIIIPVGNIDRLPFGLWGRWISCRCRKRQFLGLLS